MSEKKADSNKVFFCRYEAGNEHGAYKENTAFIYDSPYWQEDEEEDEDDGKEQPLSLSAMRSKLEGLTHHQEVECLSLSIEEADTWSNIDDPSWSAFCRAMRDLLPNVATVDMEEPHNMGDEKLERLLGHLPPRTTRLSLERIGADLPLAYRCLGTRRIGPFLETLSLCGCGPRTQGGAATFSITSGTNLALSLNQLSRLRGLSISGFLTNKRAIAWEPVLTSIRNNPRLECVRFAGGHYRVPGGYREFILDKPERQAIRYGPILNRIQKRFLAKEVLELRDFVLALVAARGRIDVLSHLLSTTDPNLYAWSAIGETKPLVSISRKWD